MRPKLRTRSMTRGIKDEEKPKQVKMVELRRTRKSMTSKDISNTLHTRQSKIPKLELERCDVDSVKEQTNSVVSDIDRAGDLSQRINQQRKAVCESVAQFKFNKKRVRVISKAEEVPEGTKGILYWISRDQRVQDNWAFLYAQRLAMKLEVPLHVCFCLVPTYLDATIRQYGFMLKGLIQVEQECRSLNIPFHLLLGTASSCIPSLLKTHNLGGIVTDFTPLRVPMQWLADLKLVLPSDVPLCQVDAHNIVPCWEASSKQDYNAYIFGNKVRNQLHLFLTEFPPLVRHPHPPAAMPRMIDWLAAARFLEVDKSVQEVTWADPGSEAGLRMLESFCESRLKYFATQRNDPTKEALSNLSPWLHFGQISAQRCVLTVQMLRNQFKESVNAFFEEAVIHRELSDNFCFYSQHYDSFKGAHNWARTTLEAHWEDKRSHLYSRRELELAKTHDDLWNAAQLQMVSQGKMHGFLRKYWGKKILEWTTSPDDALEISIYLNNKYSLDGCDPNGYVGCMWAICGLFDHGWPEKKVFGKIRYMNYSGCRRKFNISEFLRQSSHIIT